MTLRTFVPDDAPFTAAAVTRLDVYKLPEHGSGDLADLSHPAACRAGFEIFIALSSSTVTAAASGMTLHFQGFLHSRSDLLQSEFYLYFLLSARTACLSSLPALGAAAKGVTPKDVTAENITGMSENIFKIGISKIRRAAKAAPIDTRVAILIIALSFLRIS